MEKDRALHLNKLNSPSAKDDFCQVWLKLANWFWRKRYLKFVDVFCYFVIYMSLWKWAGPFKLDSPSAKDDFCKFDEIDPVVLEKKIFKICQCIFPIS